MLLPWRIVTRHSLRAKPERPLESCTNDATCPDKSHVCIAIQDGIRVASGIGYWGALGGRDEVCRSYYFVNFGLRLVTSCQGPWASIQTRQRGEEVRRGFQRYRSCDENRTSGRPTCKNRATRCACSVLVRWGSPGVSCETNLPEDSSHPKQEPAHEIYRQAAAHALRSGALIITSDARRA